MADLIARAAATPVTVVDFDTVKAIASADPRAMRLLVVALYGPDMDELLSARFGQMNHALDVLS